MLSKGVIMKKGVLHILSLFIFCICLMTRTYATVDCLQSDGNSSYRIMRNTTFVGVGAFFCVTMYALYTYIDFENFWGQETDDNDDLQDAPEPPPLGLYFVKRDNSKNEEEIKKINKQFVDFCMQGDLERIKPLVEEGADINCVNRFKNTPLHIASCEGHHDVVDYLLVKKANTVIRNQDGFTPIAFCIMMGYCSNNLAIFKRLARDCDLSLTYGQEENTLLQLAASVQKIDIVKYLIEEANVSYIKEKNNIGHTAYDIAKSLNPQGDVTKYLEQFV